MLLTVKNDNKDTAHFFFDCKSGLGNEEGHFHAQARYTKRELHFLVTQVTYKCTAPISSQLLILVVLDLFTYEICLVDIQSIGMCMLSL